MKDTISMRIENKIDIMSTNIDRKIGNIHEKVNDISIKTAKVEAHLGAINGSLEAQEKRLCSNDKRIRWCENKVHVAVGGVGVLSILLATITKMLGLW